MEKIIDKFIVIGIISFILSLITEKITTFIRKYPPKSSGIRKTVFKRNRVSNKDLNLSEIEGEKEKEAMRLNILVGILVSLLSNANLYLFIKEGDPTSILFGKIRFDPFFPCILGLILSGIFLSFGSKVFHDIVDTLLQIKNLKRKLNDEKLYKIETIQEFDEYLKLTEGQIVRKVLKENKDFLMGLPNVIGVGIGTTVRKEKRVLCIVVHLKDGNREKIAQDFHLNLPGGKLIPVPIEVIKNIDIPSVQLGPGGKIASKNNLNYFGTFGCVLKDPETKNKHILTCSHVLNNGKGINRQGKISSAEDVYQIGDGNKKNLIGKCWYAERTRTLDIALIETDLDDVSNFVDGYELKNAREVIDDDIYEETKVFIHGSVSQRQEGIIVNTKVSNSIKYKDGEGILDDLIVLSKGNYMDGWERISVDGDSGSIILDIDKNILGMVVGANKHFSYAIPMTSILYQLGKEIS